VDNVQDDMLALTIQYNAVESQNERLVGENGELVRRWMDRMGMEAERTNRESGWD
jgi:hypothetical protein